MNLDDDTYLLLGWTFFIVSSFFFTAVGIRSGDGLATLGALFFLLANVVFLIPFLRNSKFKNHD